MLSIIIPAYNEEKYISNCLKAVFGQENLQDYEVIVVDNGSTDKTVRIIKENFPQVKIVFEPKKGVTIARNSGAREAKGDVLIFFDADVIPPKNHIKNIFQKFQTDKELIALSGPYNYDGSFYIKVVVFIYYYFLVFPAEYFFNRLLNIFSGSVAGNLAVKKKEFDKINGFNESIGFYGDDTDIFMRLRKLGRAKMFIGLSVTSSSRRLKKEGALRSCARYTLNFIWLVIFHRPYDRNYNDIR